MSFKRQNRQLHTFIKVMHKNPLLVCIFPRDFPDVSGQKPKQRKRLTNAKTYIYIYICIYNLFIYFCLSWESSANSSLELGQLSPRCRPPFSLSLSPSPSPLVCPFLQFHSQTRIGGGEGHGELLGFFWEAHKLRWIAVLLVCILLLCDFVLLIMFRVLFFED